MNIVWTEEQKAKACEEILDKVSKGKSLLSVCNSGDDWLPRESTFRTWCDNDADLSARYARAREVRADVIFDELLHIADTPREGVIITEKADGTIETKRADMIEHRRLQVDARKWALSKMMPKKYGDKLDVNHGGGITVNIPQGDADL